MNDLRAFIVQTRLEYWRKQFSEDVFVGFYLLQFVFLLIYGVAIGFAMNTDQAQIKTIHATHLAVLFWLYWATSLSPWYSSKTYLFNIVHPVKASTKFFLELLYNLFDVYLILLLLIHIVVILVARNYPFVYNIHVVLVLLLAFLTQQIFRLVLDGKALKQSITVFLASAMIVVGVSYSIFYLSEWLTVGILLASLVLITGLFYVASREAYRSLPTYQSSSQVHNPWFSLYFRKRFWQVMTMALFVKVFFLFGSGILNLEAEEEIELGLMWGIVLTPFTIFSYGFANLFGHFPRIVLAIEANNGRLLDYVRFYLRMLLPILLIDQVINLLIVFIFDIPPIRWLVIYTTATLIMSPVGFLTSVRLAQVIKKNPMFSYNTAPYGSVFLILVAVLPALLIFKQYYWLGVVAVFTIIISVVSVNIYRKSASVQHRLLQKMMDIL